MPGTRTGSTGRGKVLNKFRYLNIWLYIYFGSDKVILNNALDLGKDGTDIGSALKYYDSINLYMKQLRGALGELRDDILWVTNIKGIRR